MRDFTRCTIEFPSWSIIKNHVSSTYKSNFSSKLKLEIRPQVRNTEYEISRPYFKKSKILSYMVGGGSGAMHVCIAITRNLPFIFAEIVIK